MRACSSSPPSAATSRRPAVGRDRARRPARVPDLRVGAVLDQAAALPDDDEGETTRTRRGRPPRGGQRCAQDPAGGGLARGHGREPRPHKLDIFREFVNSLDVEGGDPRGGGASRRLAAQDRPAPAPCRPPFAHRRSADQKSSRHAGFRKAGARRRTRGARVVRDADLGDGPPCALTLIISSADKKAPPDSTPDALERLAAEELAGAVDVAHPEAEEDPVGQLVRPRVDDADHRVRPLDPVARRPRPGDRRRRDAP